jgi:fimbrial chaperone protein
MPRPFLALILALAPLVAGAAEFSVSPIRLDFERGTRSAAVTVANDDARPLRMQLRLMEWTQDADGVDVYRDSEELVYFPRMMSVQPGEKRLVRVGLKSPAGAAERSYRLYLDELPSADAASTPAGSGLSFTIRFALPIFLPAAADAKPAGTIESLGLRDGKLRVAVRNAGNQHFRISSVAVRGGEGFAAAASGWYLLAGARRVHTIDIPAEVCRGLRRLDVTVKADKLSLEGGLDVEPGMCAR